MSRASILLGIPEVKNLSRAEKLIEQITGLDYVKKPSDGVDHVDREVLDNPNSQDEVNTERMKAYVQSINPHHDANRRDAMDAIDFDKFTWPDITKPPQEIDVNDPRLPADTKAASPEDIKRYSKGDDTYPPIVLSLTNDKFYIEDGKHRTAAARLRGDKTIRAYVGISKN